MFLVQQPTMQWVDPQKNVPVQRGDMYFGQPNLDPKVVANRITVYYYNELGNLVELPQPIELSDSGVPVYLGKQVDIYINVNCSIRVDDKNGAEVYYVNEYTGSNEAGPLPSLRVDNLKQLATTPAAAGSQVNVTSFYSGWSASNGMPAGGGLFAWSSTIAKSLHNGVTVYAPEALTAWNGTQADIATLLNWTGSGVGAWIRTDYTAVTFEMAGAILDANQSTGSGTDNTLSVNKVFSTGLPVVFTEGFCKIKDKITMQVGQKMTGKGRTASCFVISTDFNLSATSVLKMGMSEPSSQIVDVGLVFIQPNQGVRNSAIKYPWAIDASASPRFMLDNIRIEGGWNGVNATGNSGGAEVGFMEIGVLNVGFEVNGALDFFHVKTLHFWPFGFSSKPALLNGVYYDGIGTSLKFGLCDGADFGTISTFRTKVEITLDATSGISNSFEKIQLDGDGAVLIINGGVNSISQLYSTKSTTSTGNAILCNGGLTTIDDVQIMGDNPQVDVLVAGGSLRIDGGTFLWNNLGNPKILVNGGNLSVSGCKIRNYPTSTYTQPFARQNLTGELIFKGNSFDLKTSGTGIAVEYIGDNAGNYCMGNKFSGYGFSAPFAASLGVYQGVVSYLPQVIGTTVGGTATYTVQQGAFEALSDDLVFYSATLTYSAHTGTGGTTVTIPHNLSSLSQRTPQSVYSTDLAIGSGRQLTAFVGNSGNRVAVRAIDLAGGSTVEFIDPSGSLSISGIYRRA